MANFYGATHTAQVTARTQRTVKCSKKKKKKNKANRKRSALSITTFIFYVVLITSVLHNGLGTFPKRLVSLPQPARRTVGVRQWA